MRRLAAILPLVLAGCALLGGPPRGTHSALHGTVEGLERRAEAHIAVFRMEPGGVATRMPSADVDVRPSGRFRTDVLAPGRYLLALRAGGRPVSTVRTRVPLERLLLRARDPEGRGDLEIRRGDAPAIVDAIVASRIEDGMPVAEVRKARLGVDGVAVLPRMAAGRWRVDLGGAGWTTEVELPDRAGTTVLDLTPPPLPPLGSADLRGKVLHPDGRPVRGIAVTLRPLVERDDGVRVASAWARYAVTDSDGGYHVVGIPAGRTLLRLECRDTVYAHLPPPEATTIPPSGLEFRSLVLTR